MFVFEFTNVYFSVHILIVKNIISYRNLYRECTSETVCVNNLLTRALIRYSMTEMMPCKFYTNISQRAIFKLKEMKVPMEMNNLCKSKSRLGHIYF